VAGGQDSMRHLFKTETLTSGALAFDPSLGPLKFHQAHSPFSIRLTCRLIEMWPWGLMERISTFR
jgi:hypothetical protein